MATPASQAYVERLFSLCGEMTARKRNRTRATLYRCVFLKLNRNIFDARLLDCLVTVMTQYDYY